MLYREGGDYEVGEAGARSRSHGTFASENQKGAACMSPKSTISLIGFCLDIESGLLPKDASFKAEKCTLNHEITHCTADSIMKHTCIGQVDSKAMQMKPQTNSSEPVEAILYMEALA